MTSDDFFETNTEYFDLIFVDGLHEGMPGCFGVAQCPCRVYILLIL